MKPSADAEGGRWAVDDWISASSSALVVGSEADGMAAAADADVGAAAAGAAEGGTDAVLESPVDAAADDEEAV